VTRGYFICISLSVGARALLFALDAPTEKFAFSIFRAVFSRSAPKVGFSFRCDEIRFTSLSMKFLQNKIVFGPTTCH
jgi:hypothetical protein